MIPPAVVHGLPAQIDTAAAKAMMGSAEAAVTRPPRPMKHLHTEGTLPHQGIRDQSLEAEKDFPLTLSFSFAYRLTADKRYLVQADRYLDAWCATYKISGNPIDETRFDLMVLAFDLTRSDLPTETVHRVADFFRRMAVTYLDWLDHNFAQDPYNWSSHRVKLAVLGAHVSGARVLIGRAAHAYLRQVKQNIRQDGSVNDYYKRDALHYVVYDLEPLTMSALAAKSHGEEWFHTAATGTPSIEMAIDWLVPFAIGARTHEEFVHSSIKFDSRRNQAGEAGYSGRWEPKTCVTLMAMVASLDPRFSTALDKVVEDQHASVSAWIILATTRP